MRFFLRLFGCLLAWAILLAWSAAWAQTGYDRRGGDYARFVIKNGDPALCAMRCEHDGRCRAWAFSYPGTNDTVATCWLKNRVPPRLGDSCCISGVRGAGVIEPQRGAVEYSIDRIGGDYKVIDVGADSSGAPCKAACDTENRCRAWTYVRPGYAGPSARCFLKDRITRPRSKPCCISGVVR